MAICSRNFSLCCTVLSAWAIIQLIIMGFLFYNNAVAFSEDLGIEVEQKDNRTIAEFREEAELKYSHTVRI